MTIFLDCRVRFHYGHPDIFDRIFHLTRGGISKASKTINLSEDVFAGKLKSSFCFFEKKKIFLLLQLKLKLIISFSKTSAALEFCLQGIIPYCVVGI